ncbi:MAG: (4Fe-4S)-binding protein [Candidatus Abyssobacteria bacterium SURF_17]|uniref:(4Fe-4S)-binding protein n=1 Tax=Candidatus Abyssobacteria bacterium SURF_17 TaxID=2093361 RepID=A0A419EPX0_9BACT|nr:MAG: (4Fe-4S)-binding protein [Candidatus Abyssubacteria bacterium SURF_17]
MKIAVASGKGGTGKTTIATNLAVSLSSQGHRVLYADCDVEEPNGHIFLKPCIRRVEHVGVPIPDVDASRCSNCGACGEMCQFSAIVCINDRVLTFPELCHGCNGCILVCPESAIREVRREIGVIEWGNSNGVEFVHGTLRIGEAMAAPLIRAVKEHLPADAISIIDVPPGTSCPVIEAVRDTDFVLLVTEPTPFGFNDLQLAVEMVRALKLQFGIIINRCDVGNDEVRRYCIRENIPLLLEIPDDRRIAEAYSRGQMAVEAVPAIREQLLELWNAMVSRRNHFQRQP